ncbi:MAG: hypothetical protein SOZ42_01125 [Candidatus Enterosoma sp.]|nr:hypothetical protein [Candidatus Enterosoma sp.]
MIKVRIYYKNREPLEMTLKEFENAFNSRKNSLNAYLSIRIEFFVE